MTMKKTKKHLAFMLALVLMISCFTMESVFAQCETAGTVIVGSRKYEAVFYNSISKGKSKTIKLTGVPANKVKWNSSNKAVPVYQRGK